MLLTVLYCSKSAALAFDVYEVGRWKIRNNVGDNIGVEFKQKMLTLIPSEFLILFVYKRLGLQINQNWLSFVIVIHVDLMKSVIKNSESAFFIPLFKKGQNSA